MKEIFLPVKDFEEYQISNYGNVKGKRGTILKTCCCKSGGFYPSVTFYKNKKHYPQRIHRLVALHFIPNPYNLKTVDHIDRDTRNNNVTNLRWATIKTQANNQKTFKDRKMKNITKERYIHFDKRIKSKKKIYIYFKNKKVNNGKALYKYFYTIEQAVEYRDKLIDATTHRNI